MPDAHNSVLDKGKPDKMTKIEALRRNNMDIASLTMALVTPSAMTIVYKAMSKEYPVRGESYKVVMALQKKYNPQDLTLPPLLDDLTSLQRFLILFINFRWHLCNRELNYTQTRILVKYSKLQSIRK